MSDLPAYAIFQTFEPSEPKELSFDRHYLLYAAEGTIRLKAEGRQWTLYPARAAWLRANAPLVIENAHAVTACSVLFHVDWIAAPTRAVTVFDMSKLARELIWACRRWGPDWEGTEPYALDMFRALAGTCQRLAETPSNAWMPVADHSGVARALAYTADHLDRDLALAEVARAAHMSERSLARHFATETGMTWSQAQRRMRMIRAIEALTHSDLPVTEVALSTGYRALSAFNAAFRDFTGQTPSAFRARLVDEP